MQPNKMKGAMIYLIIILVLIFGLVTMLNAFSANLSQDTPTYSEIMVEFDNYNVSEFTLDLNSGELTYKLKSDGADAKEKKYYVPYPGLFLEETTEYREEYNAKNPDAALTEDYLPISDNTFLTSFLPYLILIALMLVFTFVIMRQTTGGGKMSQFSKANTRNQPSNGKKVTFNDVAGADEEKEELEEIVDFLKSPKKYEEIGAHVPKGVLLVGPPGTGKTLLAKAVAGEANVPFFSISGSDFVEMFVGVGASRVRDLFDQAKKHTPSIIFIDEIDAVGRQRGAGLGGGHDEREQTLNQLLVEMDGFSENQGIIIIAATNRRDILDPALLRPGRFDRQIVVNYPDIKGREEILRVHTRNKKLAPDVSLNTIAKTTAGFTGADLENLINEAALLAARDSRKAIIEKDVEEAAIKVVAGPEKKSRIVTEEDRRMTAYHEGGHALAAFYLETQDKVHHVTIIPRGQAGGFTMQLPEKDKDYVSKRWMEEEMVVLLGGRVAEKLVLNDVTTGASNDLERASKIARNMVTKYGFSDRLGTVVYGDGNNEVFLGRDYGHARNYSEEVAAEIDEEIKLFIDTAYKRCEELIKTHIDDLHRIAAFLLKHEKIDGESFEKLMKGELTEPVEEINPTEPAAQNTEATDSDNKSE